MQDRQFSNPGRAPGRRPYPSDISHRQWQALAGRLSPQSRRGRPRSTDLREVVNAVNYRWTTGCAWRMLPHDFPPWETVYTYFRNWQRSGRLKDVRAVCLGQNPRRATGEAHSPDCAPSNPTG